MFRCSAIVHLLRATTARDFSSIAMKGLEIDLILPPFSQTLLSTFTLNLILIAIRNRWNANMCAQVLSISWTECHGYNDQSLQGEREMIKVSSF